MKNPIVSLDQWTKAQTDFLKKEKEFSHIRDQMAKDRQALPWTLVEKSYTFDTIEGKKTLSQLFNGKSQLFMQHFMYGPDAKDGCPGCSFMADHVNAALPHFNQRDATFLAVSRAPLATLQAFRKRMGWDFNWASSASSDFNFDFNVSFTPKDVADKKKAYNFGTSEADNPDLPGMTMFIKDESGKIFRTFSSYGRGCEMVLGTYMMMDLLPKGRDENNFKYHPMEWVKLHDQYDTTATHNCCK